MAQEFLTSILRDPMTGAPAESIDDRRVLFADGSEYPVHRGAPVIFHPESLFTNNQVLSDTPTTQNREYRNKASFKNRLRSRGLPGLSRVSSRGPRGYRDLASQRADGFALVIGSGDRVEQYRHDFGAMAGLVCSDVQAQFGCDVVFDAHWIPVEDNTFSVVLAAEVLEHTLRPWRVAEELERVAAPDAFIQVEVPFAYPMHGTPYDFFRFTVFGLRSLFRSCAIADIRVAGGFSASAIVLANTVTNLSDRRVPRAALMASSRIAFGGLKHLDRSPTTDWRSASLPRSISMTFLRDTRARTDPELLADVEAWLSQPGRKSWDEAR